MSDYDTIPPDLSTVEHQELKIFKKSLIQMKRKLRKQMDDIDTELLGISEELRRRENKGLEG